MKSRILELVEALEREAGAPVTEIRTAEGVVFTRIAGITVIADPKCPPDMVYTFTDSPETKAYNGEKAELMEELRQILYDTLGTWADNRK